jgi:hypothetical protein
MWAWAERREDGGGSRRRRGGRMPAAARNHADTRSCRVGVGVGVRSGGPFLS